MPSRKFFINSSLAIVAIAQIVLYAIVPGPGYTGAPGDSPTGCIASGCHTGMPNSGTGSLQIVASGGNLYTPGETQQISVTITDSTEKKYGFQLSPRIDSNPKTAGAGTLIVGTDGYTVIEKNTGTLQWINHTVAGYNASNSTPGRYTYTFSWTPPATNAGTVTLYAAGEAVTGADVVTGTETYLTSLSFTRRGTRHCSGERRRFSHRERRSRAAHGSRSSAPTSRRAIRADGTRRPRSSTANCPLASTELPSR